MSVEIRTASPDEIPLVQELWREYWDSLGFPADFQSFEAERQGLPGVYAQGHLLLAFHGGRPAGTAALRRLSAVACEIKRLYVRPETRGTGIGSALLQRLIAEARADGYDAIYADTLPSMSAALSLYRGHGFVDVGPYSPDPTPGAVYLRFEPPAIAPTTR